MPKSKKLLPDEPQKKQVQTAIPKLHEQTPLPGSSNPQWFKKQSKIPIRIDTYPPPQEPKTVRYKGTDAQVINYFDFEWLKPLAENRIRKKTFQYLKRNQATTQLEPADWNDFAAQALASACEEALFDLNFLITVGNQEAAATLGRLAREIVKRVIAISDSHTAALKGVAEHAMNWPILRGRKPAFGDGEQFIKLLNVGGMTTFSQELVSKTSGKDAQAMMNLTQALLCRLDNWRAGKEPFIKSFMTSFPPPTKAEKDAASLPEFSKKSWKEWAESAWKVLMEENNGHPEYNPKLLRFGKHASSKTPLTTRRNFVSGDIEDLPSFAKKLSQKEDPRSAWLYSQLDPSVQTALQNYPRGCDNLQYELDMEETLISKLNHIIRFWPIHKKAQFEVNKLQFPASIMAQVSLHGDDLILFNRMLLESTYPELSQKTLRQIPKSLLNNIQQGIKKRLRKNIRKLAQ